MLINLDALMILWGGTVFDDFPDCFRSSVTDVMSNTTLLRVCQLSKNNIYNFSK